MVTMCCNDEQDHLNRAARDAIERAYAHARVQPYVTAQAVANDVARELAGFALDQQNTDRFTVNIEPEGVPIGD